MQVRRAVRQRELFEPKLESPTPRLPKQIQEELARDLVQWLQAVARALGKERGDE